MSIQNKTSEIITLLLKPSWGIGEIQRYAELADDYICQQHAAKIKNMAFDDGGAIKYRVGRVTVDSVLKQFGKNREEEIRILTILASPKKTAKKQS